MREYLFRGKSKDNDEWVNGSLIKTSKYCFILQDEDKVHPLDYPYIDDITGVIDGYVTPVHPETVDEYTGFKDKNGNKIFEGDIVEFLDIDKFKWKGVVVYQKEYALYLVKSNNGWEFAFYDIFEERVEVIGNIHDNKELLGE